MAQKRLTKKRKAEVTKAVMAYAEDFILGNVEIGVTFEPDASNMAVTKYSGGMSHPEDFTINFDPATVVAANEIELAELICHELIHVSSYQLNCEIDLLSKKLAPEHHERVVMALEAQTNKLARVVARLSSVVV